MVKLLIVVGLFFGDMLWIGIWFVVFRVVIWCRVMLMLLVVVLWLLVDMMI